MNVLKMQPASPSGTGMRHESLHAVELTVQQPWLSCDFQHRQLSRRPPYSIQWKRPQGRETSQTQSWRGGSAVTKATLSVAWQPRLHLRLRIRSMNKGGRLRPTDSQVNADTGCKGRRGGPLRAGNCCSQHPSQSDAALADASLSGTALIFHVCGEVGNVPREIPYHFTGKEAVTRPGSKSQLGLLI